MAEDIVTRATRKMKGLTRPGVKEPDTQPQTQTATAQSMSPQGPTQTTAGENTTNESSEHLSKRSNEVIDLSQVGVDKRTPPPSPHAHAPAPPKGACN
ncbi:uncharacterized protein PGTG_21092 [Puccinia graminis f. sp. tritici CRL 75-36-700-3]|uniref:Uncharacterized protein n=1 Tax=Puccinia graminis f. sp. tritici (strain CRL 75-36-700-3 / race SCCL) TaxID=418459 RepID=H6QQD2_PUCGT|nr:uncharacterized protein PGTG_21092 [Puccinia graminis f. sp. tritici CRL 75-36-700-3]EHS62544.1 hypothetical protein PGTG_21092 [Puccinia graminis f. sp. tritici CRL 75-36-700-3]